MGASDGRNAVLHAGGGDDVGFRGRCDMDVDDGRWRGCGGLAGQGSSVDVGRSQTLGGRRVRRSVCNAHFVEGCSSPIALLAGLWNANSIWGGCTPQLVCYSCKEDGFLNTSLRWKYDIEQRPHSPFYTIERLLDRTIISSKVHVCRSLLLTRLLDIISVSNNSHILRSILNSHGRWRLGHYVVDALDAAIGTGEVEAGGDLVDA